MISASFQGMHELVFVYGALRSGANNAHRMEGGELIGEARVKGRLYAVDWYPGLILDESADWVAGQIWKVGPDQLAALDEFEGLPLGQMEGQEYRRTKVTAYVVDHEEPLSAWVWEWIKPTDGLKQVTSGDWLDMPEAK